MIVSGTKKSRDSPSSVRKDLITSDLSSPKDQPRVYSESSFKFEEFKSMSELSESQESKEDVIAKLTNNETVCFAKRQRETKKEDLI